jgi:2-isopropylmalate synthase
VAGVKRACELADEVQFSPEDAARTEPDFLAEVVQAVIEAGATTVNIPDTVGYTMPWQFEQVIAGLYRDVPNIGRAVIAVHCHNDLGLAVANTLAAVRAGARQVECTINGLGERAGNASLEEVVMAMRTRSEEFGGVMASAIDTTKLYPTSRLVSRVTGLVVQRNKAIVGENAFAHESGIHQDGVLKERTTYEIMRAEDVGFRQNSLVLGKHSGRHALAVRLKELGFKVSDERLTTIFEQFKDLADRKKEIFDEDLEALAETALETTAEVWTLGSLHVSTGSCIPTATVELVDAKGVKHRDASTGDGPVDAIFRAIERLTGVTMRLEDYQLRAVTGGKEALGEVRVQVRYHGDVLSARGLSTDVIEASALAYLKATNRVLLRQTLSSGKGRKKK